MLTIHGLTVCVNYAEFFRRSIDRWMAGLASLTVVTTPEDVETQELAAAHGARVFVTDLFTRDGAAFNKGRAMEAARLTMPWSDWILFFDADVVPPVNWASRLQCIPGALYGCYRFEADGDDVEDRKQPRCAHDVPGVGYFQLFYSGDTACQVGPGEPLIDTHWTHGGNYDNRFMDRWRVGRRMAVREVPFRVAHIGERENWFGRGNRDAFEAMQAERKRRGGQWDHERIEVRG